jgi:hypothetical protein
VTDAVSTLNVTPTGAAPLAAIASENVSAASVPFVMRTAYDFVTPEPLGVAPKLTLTGSSSADASVAEARLTRPAPTMLTSWTTVVPSVYEVTAFASAVLTTAERIAQAGHAGCCCLITAAAPARCGVAIDVPWKNAKQGAPSQ